MEFQRALTRIIVGVGIVFTATSSFAEQKDITLHERTRIRFATGTRSKVVTGFIGGEQHDEWLVGVRKGQRIVVVVQKGLPALQPDFAYLRPTSKKRWQGIARRTGDLVLRTMSYPSSHYRFRVEVR